MASPQSDSPPVKSGLSRRNKLYLEISEHLSQKQVKSLRLLLIVDHHIAKGKVENKTPQEIFTMLEADGKIGEGNLELLKEVLVELKETRLANKVHNLERAEERQSRKRNAPDDDESPAGPYYRPSKGTKSRQRDWTDEFESADMSGLHSKLGFKVETLKPKAGGKIIQGSSIPLILPNDFKYNASTGVAKKIQGAKRTSLQVVPEALELLEGIEEPISVLAICGPCRSGKSYILSRLLGSVDAFELGHSMAPQTFGIWMGTKVLRGKDFTIVLLDTEGIDAVGATAGQDASILVMTILLSSKLIYNSLNVAHKTDLEKMQCFIQLAKGVTVTQGEKIQRSLFRKFFPDFLWLLRDVSLKMQDEDGKEMDPTEYLKTKVLERDPDEFDESTSDKVGRAILTFFPSVECAILERPSGDTEVMTNIAQHTDRLKRGFNKGVENLTECLLLKSRAKRGYDKVSTISGVALSIMTKQYVAAVNDPKAIPALENTWRNTVELMQGRAIDEAVKEYRQQMQSQIATATNNGQEPLEESPEREKHAQTVTRGRGKRRARGRGIPITRNLPSQLTLMDLHNKVIDEVTDMLVEKIGHFGISSIEQSSENKSVVERMQNRLVQREERAVGAGKQKGFVVIGGELLRYIQQNKDLSRTFCQGLFERLLDPIRKHTESPPADYDFQKLKKELTEAHKQYEEQARGPEKWIVLQEMTQNTENLKDNFEKVKGYEIKIMEEQQKAYQANLENKEMAREIQELRRQAQDREQAQQETLQKMERQHREQIEKIKQEWEERLAVELQKIEDLQDAKMEKEATIARERLEKEKSKTNEIIKKMEKDQADMQMKLEELEKPPPSPPPSTPERILRDLCPIS